mgnify:FL=1
MTTLKHDVDAKQAERERIAAQMAEWEAKNGKPVCHPPTVRAQQKANYNESGFSGLSNE